MVSAPCLADLYTFALNERDPGVAAGIDTATIALYGVCRFIVLLAFVYVHSSTVQRNIGVWCAVSAVVVVCYLAAMISYLVYAVADEMSHKYYPIRKITIYSEVFAIPALFLFSLYLTFQVRNMQVDVREKSLGVMTKRDQEIETLITEAE